MTPTEFSTFKYQHTDQAHRTKARRVFVLTCVVVALVAMGWRAFPVGAVFLVVALIAWFSAPRQLLLGPRYLLCGDAIVYFANVKRVKLASAQGKLQLECANGKTFILERDKFPTGARKADKIAANQAKKFEKVSSKIVDKVRAASANVVVNGA